MRITKSHIIEIIWIVFGQIVVLFGGIASIKIFTYMLEPAEYGVLALGLTLAAISQLVWAGPLQQAINRYIAPCSDEGRINDLLITGAKIYLLSAIIQVIVIYAILTVFDLIYGVESTLYYSIIIGVLIASIQPLFDIPQGIYLQLRQRKRVSIYQAIQAVIKPTIVVVTIVVIGKSAISAMIGLLISGILLAIIVSTQAVLMSHGGVASRNLSRSIIYFGYPYVTWGLLAWGVSAGDRWVLESFTSTSTVGLYVAALQVSTIIPRVTGQVLNSFLVPILNALAGSCNDPYKMKKAIHYNTIALAMMFIFGVVGTVIMYVYGKEMMLLLTSSKYATVYYLLPMIFAGAILTEMANLTFGVGPLLYKPGAFIYPRVTSYIIMVILMVVLSYMYGVEGMVLAYILGSGINFFASGLRAVRLYRNIETAVN